MKTFLLSTAVALIALAATSPVVAADPLVCAGKVWKPAGGASIEIGHGIYQCSFKGQAIRRVLSVCKIGERCTVRAKIAERR